jgi:hypothetical protein
MILGEDGWPVIRVGGDEDAEDYVGALARESKLQAKFMEIRDRGGSCGTACASFAFVNGRPRVMVHDATNMTVLEWADRYESRPARVLESYPYEKMEIRDGKPKQCVYYYARYWDEESETIWEPIPEEQARDGTWTNAVASKTVVHSYAFCPVYWCQNKSNSQDEDGFADYYNNTDEFDAINRLTSATLKGTIANVDPTLVIKDDRANNSGSIKKGSENAIYSKGGAEYLELRGDSIKTSIELAKRLQQSVLDSCSVLLADIEYISARAQSAAALRMVYQPMVSQCDILRLQYGTFLTQILGGMLTAAKIIIGTAPGPVENINGQLIQFKPTVALSKKFSYGVSPEGNRIVSGVVDRTPGEAEFIELTWPVYFKPTQQDVQMVVAGIVQAIDKTISQRTAIKNTSAMFGVTDIDQEMADIEADKDREVARQIETAEGVAEAESGQEEPGAKEETTPGAKAEPAAKEES